MKVKKLINMLTTFAELEPEAEVVLHGPEGNKVLFCSNSINKPDIIYLQTEDDVYVNDEIKSRFSSLTTMMNDFFKDMKDTGFDINQVLEGCDEEMYKELIKHYYNDESEEE